MVQFFLPQAFRFIKSYKLRIYFFRSGTINQNDKKRPPIKGVFVRSHKIAKQFIIPINCLTFRIADILSGTKAKCPHVSQK